MNAKTKATKEARKHMVKIIVGDGAPIIARKINRNNLCPCGSGKKVKRCCGFETKYYYTKKSLKDKSF